MYPILLKDSFGKPLKVYHGSPDPTNLDQDREIFFAFSPAVANAYAMYYNEDYEEGAVVFSAYLEMKNPLFISRDFLTHYAEKILLMKDDSIEKFADNFEDSFVEEREIIIKYAKNEGYDSMVMPEDSLPVECMGGDWDLQQAYVVFSPKQVHFNLKNTNEV